MSKTENPRRERPAIPRSKPDNSSPGDSLHARNPSGQSHRNFCGEHILYCGLNPNILWFPNVFPSTYS